MVAQFLKFSSSSFKSISRKQRDIIFANKTNPPDIGKYNIHYVDSEKNKVKATSIVIPLTKIKPNGVN